MTSAGRVLIDARPGSEPIARWLRDQLAVGLEGAAVTLDPTVPTDHDVLLVLIGPGWAESPGGPAVEQALASGATVISLLVWGAPLPAVGHLPPSLLPITQHPVRRLDSVDYEHNVRELITELRGRLPPGVGGPAETTVIRPPPPAAAGSAAAGPAAASPPGGLRRRFRPWMLLGVAVLLGVIAGVLMTSVRELDQAASPPTPPGGPGGDNLPRAAEPLPDDVLVWRRELNGVWNVSTVDVTDGSTGVELAVGDENGAQVISHDRRTVLYLRNRGDGGIDLHAVSADGSQDRILFSDGRPACPRLRRPAWSAAGLLAIPCGPELAGDHDSLNLMTLDGALLRQLDEGFLGDPTFSADGTRLVYPKTADGNGADCGALYGVLVDGSAAPTRLTSEKKTRDDDPVFAPEDDVVAFSRSDGDEHWIAMLDLSGNEPGEVTDLTSGKRVDRDPSWSPDGTELAFRRGEDLYVVDRAGKDRVVVDTDENGTKPAWTPR